MFPDGHLARRRQRSCRHGPHQHESLLQLEIRRQLGRVIFRPARRGQAWNLLCHRRQIGRGWRTEGLAISVVRQNMPEIGLMLRSEMRARCSALFNFDIRADPDTLESLLENGLMTCSYQQRNALGKIDLIMGLEVTEAGDALLRSQINWRRVATGVAVVGASWVVMDLVVLYWG